MTNQKDQNWQSRQETIETLLGECPQEIQHRLITEVRALIQDLNVHQAELEAQNDELRLSREDMERARDNYLNLYHNAPVGYLVLNASAIILHANKTFADMVGESFERLKGKPFQNYVEGKDSGYFLSRYKAFFKDPQRKTIDIRIASETGKTLHAQLEGRKERAFLSSGDADDSETQLLMIVSDVSELKNKETALERSLEDSRRRELEISALLRGSRAVLDYRDFNEAARAVFDICKNLIGATSGYVALLSEDGLENEVLFLEAGGRPCDVDPELPMPIRGFRAEAYKTGETVYDNNFANSEWMRYMPEGHVRLDNVMFAPLVLEGKTVGIMGLANKSGDFDETDRKLAGAFGEIAAIALRNSRLLEEIEASEFRFKQLFSHMGNGVAIYNAVNDGEDFIFADVNESGAKTSLIDKNEVIGKKVSEVFPGIRHIGLLDAFRRVWKTGRPEEFPTVQYKDDRISIWFENYVYKLPSGELVAIFENVTNRQEAEERRVHLEAKLRHAQKMEAIGTLAGGIAHDFNNLLSVILGNTELAMEDTYNWSPIYDYLAETKKASLRARDIIRQILVFAQKSVERKRAVNLEPVIRDVLKSLGAPMPHNIRIEHHFHADQDLVFCNPAQIQQILMNLFRNASDAMEEKGGVLTLELKNERVEKDTMIKNRNLSSGDYVKLCVSDTGTGIEPEITERIFDPYFTTKEVGKGSGLGLSVIQGILYNLGGEVTVDSQLGRGTTFKIWIPLADANSEKRVFEPERLPEGNETVLLVDDEERILKLGGRILESLGYKVELKISPLQALEAFRTSPDKYDVVITDMVMPDMTGTALAHTLLSIREDIPVILCTGYSDLVDEKKVLHQGIRGVILKPMTREEIAISVRKALDHPNGK